MSEPQEGVLSLLVEYVLALYRNSVAIEESACNTGGTLIAGYFEQCVNALVYELFFPELLQRANLHFFRLVESLKLLRLPERVEKEPQHVAGIFEEIYRPEHSLRQSLSVLDTIDEIRVIEGKS